MLEIRILYILSASSERGVHTVPLGGKLNKWIREC
jgi:hypothetical protein